MSLKEKASEDGGRVVYRRAQKGGMERLHKHLYIMCSVHVSRRKEKIMLCMQDFLTDISGRAATVSRTHARKNIHKMRHLV